MLQLQANFMNCLLTGKGKLSFDPSHLPIFFLLKIITNHLPPLPPTHTHSLDTAGHQRLGQTVHGRSHYHVINRFSTLVVLLREWRGGVQMLLIAS